MLSALFRSASRALFRFNVPVYYGFFEGHWELSVEEVDQIWSALENGEDPALVEDYERRFSGLIGEGHSTAFAAGRMGFYCLLKALGIGPGDEVILPAFTCPVMLNAVQRCGASVVLSDVDRDTLGSDPAAVQAVMTQRTHMIVAQHSFGIPCVIEEIARLARSHGVFLLEDAATSLGSARSGVPLGEWGDAALFSTDHTKPLNTVIGGLIYTKNLALNAKLKALAAEAPYLDRRRSLLIFDQFLFERACYVPERYGRSVFALSPWRFLYKIQRRREVFREEDLYCLPSVRPGRPYPARFPAFLAQLGLFELERWKERRVRRKNILKQYIGIMERSGLGKAVLSGYRDERNDIVPLRFVFLSPGAAFMNKLAGAFLDVRRNWFPPLNRRAFSKDVDDGDMTVSFPCTDEVVRGIVNLPCLFSEKSRTNLMLMVEQACRKLADKTEMESRFS